jgi:PAS domain S-box-containing protein
VALGRKFWPTWRDWFLGDALANLVITPLLLCLALDWRKFIKARPMRYLEGFVLFAGMFFAIQFAYQRGLNNPGVLDLSDYIPMGFLLWAAVRFGPAGASGSLAIMSLLSITAAAASHPVFVPDDTDSILNIQLFLIVIGVPIMSLSVLIEQHRRTEHSLRESEERFRNMADTAPVMIVVADAKQNATFFNKAWTTFAGRTLEQETGRGWIEGVHPDDLESCLTGISWAYAELMECHLQYRLRRADGEYRFIICKGVPRFERDKTFTGFIASCIDITELKLAQEENLGRQKLESVGVLAAGIAHDFNNLLGGMLAEAELVAGELPAGSDLMEEVQRIKDLGVRGSEIVRQLMVYAGRETEDFEPVELTRLVEEMLDLLKVSVSKRAILKTNLAKNLPAIKGNAPQLRQVVMNLIINASEALGEMNGIITVTTSFVIGGKDLARESSMEFAGVDLVRLEVSDTGSGFSEELRGKIFDPFFTTKFTGRGLGLAVVQGVVRGHGGVIKLVSAPGKGATFQIFFPCASQSAEQDHHTKVPASAEHVSVSTMTVLFVEDEDTLRTAVAKSLRKRGFLVIEAADGSAAIDALRDALRHIDVILLDLTIPGADSHEVAEEAQRIRPAIKIVITSAYGQEAGSDFLKLPQVVAYIRKPFQADELARLLRETVLRSPAELDSRKTRHGIP